MVARVRAERPASRSLPGGGFPARAATLAREDSPTARVDADAASLRSALYLHTHGSALDLLGGRDDVSRAALAAAYQRLGGESLAQAVHSSLSGEDLIKACALLGASSWFEDVTTLALGLIPEGTSEKVVFGVFDSKPLAERQALDKRYRGRFGDGAPGGAIGKGTLLADITADYGAENWRTQKLAAMLDRDLTQADHLYFFGVGRKGTDEAGVNSIIRSHWAQGPAAFARLEADWNAGPHGKGSGDGKPWTPLDFAAGLRDELGGDDLAYAEAILASYEQLKDGAVAATDNDPSGAMCPPLADSLARLDPEKVEDAQLEVAWKTVEIALGTMWNDDDDKAQLADALATIRRIWAARKQRAGEEKDPDLKAKKLAQAAEGWNLAVTRAKGRLDGELTGTENTQAKMSLGGDLTDADRFYLAAEQGAHDKALNILLEAWKGGRANAFVTDAGAERKFTETGVVRPKFTPKHMMLVNTGDHRQRVECITDYFPDDRRGSALLWMAFQKSGDAALEQATSVLGQAPAGQQSAIVERFVEFHGPHLKLPAGERPGQRLGEWVVARFEGSSASLRFQDLVDPISGRPQKEQADLYRDRAKARVAASKSGVMNAVVRGWLADYDRLTGERTLPDAEVAEARLDDCVKLIKAGTPEQIALVANETGKTAWELAGAFYDDLMKRLGDVEAKVKLVTEAISTATELAVAAVITAATGGTAGGLFIAALASTVAGMLVHEGALGANYELQSEENAAKLAAVVAGAGMGAFGSSLLEGAEAVDAVRKVSRMGVFINDATREAFSQLGTQTVSLMFSNKLPTEADIAAAGVSLLAGGAAAGTAGAIKHGIKDTAPLAQALRTTFIAQVAQGTINASGELAVQASGTETSGSEFLGAVGQKAFKVVGGSVMSTLGDVGAMRRRAAQARASEAASAQSGGDDKTPGSPAPEDHAPAPAATTPDKSQPTPKDARIASEDVAHYPDGLVHYDLGPLEAQMSYARSVAEQPDSEAAIYYNRETDRWLVVQGNNRQVTSEWRGLAELKGQWELHKHFHPGAGGEARFPSSADFRSLRQQAHAAGGKEAVKSVVEYHDAKGKVRFSEFGYRPGEGYYLRYVDPETGTIELKTFVKDPWVAGSDFKAFLDSKGIADHDVPAAAEHDLATPAAKPGANGAEEEPNAPHPMALTTAARLRRDHHETLSRHADLEKQLADIEQRGHALEADPKQPGRGALAKEAVELGRAIAEAAMGDRVAEITGLLAAKRDELPVLKRILGDPAALRRIAEKGENLNHVKGQLFEELISAGVKSLLNSAEGRKALLGDGAPDDVELIPGHAIREKRTLTFEVNGKTVTRELELQFSDGLIVRHTDKGIEVVAIVEAKSGHKSGSSLSEKDGSRFHDFEERQNYAIEVFLEARHGKDWAETLKPVPKSRDVYRQNKAAIDAIEKQLPTSHAGQAVLDIERQVGGVFVWNRQDVKLLGGRKSTRVLGFMPSDVKGAVIENGVTAEGVKFESRPEDQLTAAQTEALGKAIIALPTMKSN
jgi:hypothetical protein